MKKITVLIAMSFLMICSTVFGQTAPATTEQPKHQGFVYVGTNYSPGYPLSYSAEVGTWGQKASTSYSIVFDAVPSYGTSTLKYFIGPKMYFTTHSEDKICYMVYIAPKVSLDKAHDGLIEFGFDPYYTISKTVLFGVTIGDQVTTSGQWNLFGSAGFVFLLPKAKK